jgi:mycoredoxin
VNDDTTSAAAADPVDSSVTVYWRPGCGFCSSLLRQLDASGLPHRRVNIWEDEHAAATVRSFARGNETVPTVVIGDVGLVNPSLAQIEAAIAASPGAG